MRRLRILQRSMRQRPGCEVLTLPIEVEPGAAWQQDPAEYSLGHGPYDLDYFLRRHRTISTPPGPDTWHGEEMEEMLRYLET